MKAILVRKQRFPLLDGFADVAIWQVPQPVPPSEHAFKYRLAYIVKEVCVVRFDNERGKGDHYHLGEKEFPYVFTDLPTLLADFLDLADKWGS